MTDENQEPEVPEFDDPSYADLRGLLADAAAPAAMPADVAARLDATLAELVADRVTSKDETVVPLRRRRPIGQRLLVAAAAVVLVGAGGVGVAQVLDNTQQNNDSAATATADRDSSVEAPVVPGASAPEAAAGGTGSSNGLGAVTQRNLMARLSTTEFSKVAFPRQVTELVEAAAGRAASADKGGNLGSPSPQQYASGDSPLSDGVQQELQNLDLALKAAPPCAGPALPEGAVALRITFDGRPAALVLHPVVVGSRYVAAWSCDGHQLLAFTTLSS